MYYLLVILVRSLDVAISAIQLLMLIRAVFSWIPDMGDNVINNFVCTVTEPVIAPVRAIMERFNIMQGLPIDMSFMITYFLLFAVQMLLPSI